MRFKTENLEKQERELFDYLMGVRRHDVSRSKPSKKRAMKESYFCQIKNV